MKTNEWGYSECLSP